MSVDALVQVFKDRRAVSPGVQAVLIALAWKTPKGRDSTSPVSYGDLAALTHYHPGTVRRLVGEAIETGAVEIVWARSGGPSRYRVNRGDWHVPSTPAGVDDPFELIHNPAQIARGSDPDNPAQIARTPAQIARTSPHDLRGDPAQIARPLRREEEDIEEKGQGTLFAEKNAALLIRLREKGLVE